MVDLNDILNNLPLLTDFRDHVIKEYYGDSNEAREIGNRLVGNNAIAEYVAANGLLTKAEIAYFHPFKGEVRKMVYVAGIGDIPRITDPPYKQGLWFFDNLQEDDLTAQPVDLDNVREFTPVAYDP